MRRLVVVIGVAAALVGAWSLHRVRDEAASCQLHSVSKPGFGISSSCLDQVHLEYLAFGVLIAGLFVVAFGLLLMRKYRNVKGLARGERHFFGTPGESPEFAQAMKDRYGSRPATSSMPSPPEPPADPSVNS
ncbi:MAG: hypothetical protein ACREGR_04015 [Minisyncoccia bacterium]